tara:strand:+ start:34 stop:261 length:228 start_codon:yes stop_codon:yes gene_type:complete
MSKFKRHDDSHGYPTDKGDSYGHNEDDYDRSFYDEHGDHDDYDDSWDHLYDQSDYENDKLKKNKINKRLDNKHQQ